MKKVMIIVTGSPGSGKTSLAMKLCRLFPEIEQLSYDALKEQFFDKYGFDNAREKEQLNERSLQSFYQMLDKEMETGKMLLIEYPFCKKHEEALKKIAEKHEYQMLTVLLVGDMKTLYLRGVRRDSNAGRHLGHLLNRYHRDVPPKAEDWIPKMEFDEYVRMCKEKDYDVQLGKTIRVDITDVKTLDIDSLYQEIRNNIKEY